MNPLSKLSDLRSSVLIHSLFAPTTLAQALKRLGFVQADPIRSPARCQDLILRHRVKDYKAGDLEKRYSKLDLEEDFTFAYGFLRKAQRDLLYPRPNYDFTQDELEVIDTVREKGPMNSADLQEIFGKKSVRNGWGGKSQFTKRVLEKAHHHGLLRISHRKKGIRHYGATNIATHKLSPTERFERLLLLNLQLFGPTSESFLLKETNQYGYLVSSRAQRKAIVGQLADAGELAKTHVDGADYILPKSKRTSAKKHTGVKLLAPFDPIVRDRDRFEHLWKWPYRFEAYVPAAKRQRGYYALPMLWNEKMVGWANARVQHDQLHTEIGYEGPRINSRAHKAALETEISALATFLHLPSEAWTLTYL